MHRGLRWSSFPWTLVLTSEKVLSSTCSVIKSSNPVTALYGTDCFPSHWHNTNKRISPSIFLSLFLILHKFPPSDYRWLHPINRQQTHTPCHVLSLNTDKHTLSFHGFVSFDAWADKPLTSSSPFPQGQRTAAFIQQHAKLISNFVTSLVFFVLCCLCFVSVVML